MSVTIKFNLSSFERAAKRMGGLADQVPYALARSLNDAAEIARTEIIEDVWPSSIKMRNKSFIRAALTTRGTRATKKNLKVVLYDKLGRANLQLHADGGTRKAKRGKLAIPGRNIKRTARGVSKGQRPRALPNSFVQGDIIYQRVGVKARHLKLMYILKRSTRIGKDVPFRRSFKTTMQREVPKAFKKRFAEAMKTRRSR